MRGLISDVKELEKLLESKEYEIKILRDQKAALTKVKSSKNKEQEIINQLNA